MVLAACGGGGDDGVGHLPDAPPGPTDAPSGPTAGPVTLTVKHNGAGVANVHTYFLNADDSVVATVNTDTNGVATATMLPGGSVTAIDPFPVQAPPAVRRRLVVSATAPETGSHDLRTFEGVKPGDQLLLTEDDPPQITVTVIAPAFDGAVGYGVFTSCGSGELPAPDIGEVVSGAASAAVRGAGRVSPAAAIVRATSRPATPAVRRARARVTGRARSAVAITTSGSVSLAGCNNTADVLLMVNDSDGVLLASIYHPNVPVTDGGNVDLSNDTYSNPVTVTFNYTNLPAEAAGISLTHTLASARGQIIPLSASNDLDGSGTAQLTITEPSIAGAVGIVDTSIVLDGLHHFIDVGPVAATYALDVGSVILHDLFNGTPTNYNPTTQQVSWVELAGGATPDLSFVAIDASRGASQVQALPVSSIGFLEAPPPPPPTLSWHWAVAAPYTPGEVRYPTLPTDLASWAPVAGSDSVSSDTLINAKVTGGYDAARAHVYSVITDETGLITGPTGRVVTVTFTSAAARQNAGQ